MRIYTLPHLPLYVFKPMGPSKDPAKNIYRAWRYFMSRQMDINKFARNVQRYVKNGIPKEMKKAGVYVARLDTGDGAAHVGLLISRPWNGTATVFFLDGWYKQYSDGAATAESTAAAIINDRRIYHSE